MCCELYCEPGKHREGAQGTLLSAPTIHLDRLWAAGRAGVHGGEGHPSGNKECRNQWNGSGFVGGIRACGCPADVFGSSSAGAIGYLDGEAGRRTTGTVEGRVDGI